MVAMELGIPKEKFAKAMDYLKENAKTFEEVRIGAAAVEAWGVKDCPFKLDEWFAIAGRHIETSDQDGSPEQLHDGGAREIGSCIAFVLRLRTRTAAQESRIAEPDARWTASAVTAGGARRARRRPTSNRPIA